MPVTVGTVSRPFRISDLPTPASPLRFPFPQGGGLDPVRTAGDFREVFRFRALSARRLLVF